MRERRNYGLSVEERRRKNSYNRYLKTINRKSIPINDIIGEVWRPVVGVRGAKVSNKGRIKATGNNGVEKLCRVFNCHNTYRVYVNIGYVVNRINVAKAVYESFVLQHRFKGDFFWRPVDGDKSNASLENISIDPKMRTPWYKTPQYKLDALMDAFWTQTDNSDSTLAKEFNIAYSIVRDYITYRLDLHFNKINNR